jgi:hypothetical protein
MQIVDRAVNQKAVSRLRLVAAAAAVAAAARLKSSAAESAASFNQHSNELVITLNMVLYFSDI